jgi:hypothetical protein
MIKSNPGNEFGYLMLAHLLIKDDRKSEALKMLDDASIDQPKLYKFFQNIIEKNKV